MPAGIDAPGGALRLGEAWFDRDTGALLRIGSLDVDGPQPELWRAPTENDSATGGPGYEVVDPATSGDVPSPESLAQPSAAARWRERGLDYKLAGVRPPAPESVIKARDIFRAAGLLAY